MCEKVIMWKGLVHLYHRGVDQRNLFKALACVISLPACVLGLTRVKVKFYSKIPTTEGTQNKSLYVGKISQDSRGRKINLIHFCFYFEIKYLLTV